MDICVISCSIAGSQSDRFSSECSNGGLSLPFVYGRTFVAFRNIMVLCSESNYTRLFFTNKSEYLSSCTMGYLLSKLPPDIFIRIHHGHAVNREFVKSVNRNYVLLIDGSRWEISRRKQKQVLECFRAAFE